MADYISRDYTVENMEKYPWDTEHDKNAAIHLVRELVPAADVRPVMRGKWANEHLASTSGGTYAVIRCSVCKSQFPLYKTNYCPNCGAYMREEVPTDD